MVKGFEKYLVEGLGANTMERDPVDLIMRPDLKQANAMMAFSGTSGAVPTHWNNSPFLSGGRLTSAFGLNPKPPKKKTVLSYREFIDSTKRLSK